MILTGAEVYVAPADTPPPTIPSPRQSTERPMVPRPLRCRWCPHPWHGLPCTGYRSCRCESAFTARDDTWRPVLSACRVDQVAKVMHDTGVDGWAAQVAVDHLITPHRNPYRVRSALYGRSA